MTDMVTVSLKILGGACTDSALGFENPDNDELKPIWIPRSQIHNLEEVLERQLDDGLSYSVEEMVDIDIPTWLAEEKGLDIIAEEVSDESW